MQIVIPFKTPTVNMMYATFNGYRVKSKEAREKAKKVKIIVDNSETKQIDGPLSVNIEVYSNWYNKDGFIKKRDITNLEKFIIDSIFSALPNMDDSQIFEITMFKTQSEEDKSIINIEALE